jgi:regulator of replication initiation timing
MIYRTQASILRHNIAQLKVENRDLKMENEKLKKELEQLNNFVITSKQFSKDTDLVVNDLKLQLSQIQNKLNKSI